MWEVTKTRTAYDILKLQNPREAQGVVIVGDPWSFQCPYCGNTVWVMLRLKVPPRVILKRCTELTDEWGNRILEHDYDPV